MFFLLRVAFWLSIVVLLLPAPADPRADPNKPQVSTFETLGAAKTALEDAREFCARKPEACESGSHAMQAFGHKAQYGAKLLYDFISARVSDAPKATPAEQPGRHTLTPADQAPAWSAPGKVPLPPRRPT
jgi:hypothetical protein